MIYGVVGNPHGNYKDCEQGDEIFKKNSHITTTTIQL